RGGASQLARARRTRVSCPNPKPRDAVEPPCPSRTSAPGRGLSRRTRSAAFQNALLREQLPLALARQGRPLLARSPRPRERVDGRLFDRAEREPGSERATRIRLH